MRTQRLSACLHSAREKALLLLRTKVESCKSKTTAGELIVWRKGAQRKTAPHKKLKAASQLAGAIRQFIQSVYGRKHLRVCCKVRLDWRNRMFIVGVYHLLCWFQQINQLSMGGPSSIYVAPPF